MRESPSFERLLSGIQHGHQDQVGDMIVRRFAERLIALTSGRIGNRLRQRVTEDDIVQSVFLTFFRRLGDGQFELRNWESLWGLLAQAAVWRICRQAQYHSAQKRTWQQEQGSESLLVQEVWKREPDTTDLLVAEELHAQLMSQIKEQHQPIVQLILDGATHEAIARELKVSLSTVERVHRRAKECLSAILLTAENA